MASPKDKEGRPDGFLIKKDIVTKLTEMPRPINDRIMTMRLPLSKDNFDTIISVYAPTMTNPDENKEAFYNQLASVLNGELLLVLCSELELMVTNTMFKQKDKC